MQTIPFAANERVVVVGEHLGNPQDTSCSEDSAWVRLLRDLVVTHAPTSGVEIIDRTGPDMRVHLMRQRWADDVLWYQPDWLIIHTGLCDVWHHIDDKHENMSPDEISAALEKLIARTRERFPSCKIVLLDPIHLEMDDDPAWHTGRLNAAIPGYTAALEKLAEKTDSIFVPAQKLFIERLHRHAAQYYGESDAHPEQEGHALLAHHVLKACGGAFPGTPAISKKQTVVFIGDSITDANRRSIQFRPYGFGYMRLWRSFLFARETELAESLTIVNRGIAGNTIRNLKHRWQRDCLAHKPDHLVVKIGINDVNRWLCNGADPVSPEDYETILRELLTQSRSQNPDLQIWLISPFFLCQEDNPESYRQKVHTALPDYINAMERVAKEFKATFIDTHARFQNHLQHRPTKFFGMKDGEDNVHPSQTGCLVIAEALYEAMCS